MPAITQSKAHEVPSVPRQSAAMQEQHDITVALPIEVVQVEAIPCSHSSRNSKGWIAVANSIASRECEK